MAIGIKKLFIILTVLGCVLSRSTVAQAETGKPVISTEELATSVAHRRTQVPEFQFIRQEAEKMGQRVWLFGGTAAAYVHYVRWDLERQKGQTQFQADRFDYDFTNIYRSTQDLDIVVDGTPAQVQEFQRRLVEKYPFFLGSSAKWEVRSLRSTMGIPGEPTYKEALLNSFDFLNQDTDSNSTGLVELSQSKESVIRDLKDWNSNSSPFLKDAAQGRDTFYRSPTHFQTSRAKLGQNPEIFSVIRALTKAFQYELQFSPADLTVMQKIIDDFKPNQIQDQIQGEETLRRLKDISKKLYKNAVNIEVAWNTLEKNGLRQKLMAFDDKNEEGSLAWWMNKEPLRTYQVGAGNGKTAAQLAADLGMPEIVVSHETTNFLAYESITRAQTGDANVLSSRKDVKGELADYGDGFYVKMGHEGARGTGLTIRFYLDPKAREGTDFIFVPEHHFLVIRNKAVLKVIPESLKMSVKEYLKIIADNKAFADSDRGILEKFKRRLKLDAQMLSPQEEEEVIDLVTQVSQWQNAKKNENFLRSFLELKIWEKHPQLIDQILSERSEMADQLVAELVLTDPNSAKHPRWLTEIIQRGFVNSLVMEKVLSLPHWQNQGPQFVQMLLDQKNLYTDYAVIRLVLDEPGWEKYPELVQLLIQRGRSAFVVEKLFSKPQWATHPELLEEIVRQEVLSPEKFPYLGHFFKSQTEKNIEAVLENDFWQNQPQLKALCRAVSANGAVTLENLKLAWSAVPVVATAPQVRCEALFH